LVLLDGLIQNAGSRFQRTFADEPLLERLRLLPRDDVVDPQVQQKCRVLFVQWANAYKNTAGLERIANLYKELPKSQRPQAARAKVLQDSSPFGDSDDDPPASRSRATSTANRSGTATPVTLGPTSSSHFSSKLSKSKKGGDGKPFNLYKERESMTNAIAQSSIASTNLLNGLQLINRETQRPSENPEVVKRFEACKNLRRRILYYIQHVESDEWIGSLVNANDELVKALTAYEITDRSIDDDSDSEFEHSDHPPPKVSTSPSTSAQHDLAGLKLEDTPPAKPPRPGNIGMPAKPSFPSAPPPPPQQQRESEGEDEDDDDPFGDSNAAPTPHQERSGMTWREV
jgi:hypothetical protein